MYTEDQVLNNIQSISSDIVYRISDEIFGLTPGVTLRIITDRTPPEFREKYGDELKEFASLCYELEMIAERAHRLSEQIGATRKQNKIKNKR